MDISNTDSIGERTKLINIAQKYTGGDIEKARLMMTGQYYDVTALKGRFFDESVGKYGIFIIFINTENKYIMNIKTVIMPDSAVIEKMRIFDSWKTFNNDISALAKTESARNSETYEFSNHLAKSIIGYNIYDEIKDEDLDGTTRVIVEIINKFHDSDQTKCQVVMEKSNSLALETAGVPIEIYSGDDTIEEKTAAETENDKLIQQIESQVEHVIPGRIIVSPVRGKYINDVQTGDSIIVQLINQDEVSKKVAKFLKAYTEEGDFLPIKGRIKGKISMGKSGYMLYALIAKNVLAKIVEEENVKIEMEDTVSEAVADKIDTDLMFYIFLLVGLVLLTIILLLLIL